MHDVHPPPNRCQLDEFKIKKIHHMHPLNMWIAGCRTTDEVRNVFYGAYMPQQHRSEVLTAYLIEIAARMGAGEDGTHVTE